MKELPKVPTWRLEQSRTHDPSDERCRLYQCATHTPNKLHDMLSVNAHFNSTSRVLAGKQFQGFGFGGSLFPLILGMFI